MNNMLATPLQIGRNLHITPLIGIENPTFAKHYHDGLCWSLSGDYKGNKPFTDAHLVANLKRDAAKGRFDSRHEDSLLYVGFYFGAVHGCLLSPETGAIRSDMTTLITFTHPDARHGYYVGRRDRCMNTPPNEGIYTDTELLEQLRQIALDLAGYPDETDSWYYSIGCLLGNMSLQVFPATPQEQDAWEAEYRAWREQYEQERA
jgi:hypothetical protein